MTARDVVQAALDQVLGVAVVPRDDTPLRALGLDSVAWPPLAAVIRERSTAHISDADANAVVTFGELVALVEQRCEVVS